MTTTICSECGSPYLPVDGCRTPHSVAFAGGGVEHFEFLDEACMAVSQRGGRFVGGEHARSLAMLAPSRPLSPSFDPSDPFLFDGEDVGGHR